MHRATPLTLAFLLVLIRETGGRPSNSGGNGVALNVSARTGGSEHSSAYYENERVKASAVAKVHSVPVSASLSPVTPSPSIVVETPPPEAPLFPVDFTTTENSLRTYIFQANVEKAAKVLMSPKVVSLAAGLTYPPELSPLVQPSAQRNEDPDVVAYKALALSALHTGEARKLATVAILSLRPDCQCAVFTSEEQDELIDEFTKNFMDTASLKEILKADANTELVPDGNRRRLTVAEASPVEGFVCAHCWPKKECKAMHWC